MSTLIERLEAVTKIRLESLDKLDLKSSGACALFLENIAAANDIIDSRPNMMMRNGMTALDYASGFGEAMGMSAVEWANWIISENKIYVSTGYEIEREYLRLKYSDLPAMSARDGEMAIELYRKFCKDKLS